MRKLNVKLYTFRWLADEIVNTKKPISELAKNINRSPHTIYNWLSGLHLIDSINHPNQKDDVAPVIAEMLECDVDTVRTEIKKCLQASGKLYKSDDNSSFRSELLIFTNKIKGTCKYDNETLLTPEKREVILAILNVLDKI